MLTKTKKAFRGQNVLLSVLLNWIKIPTTPDLITREGNNVSYKPDLSGTFTDGISFKLRELTREIRDISVTFLTKG